MERGFALYDLAQMSAALANKAAAVRTGRSEPTGVSLCQRRQPITVNTSPSFSQLRLMSEDDLAKELAARDHDDATRSAIQSELLRRIAGARSRPNWVQWLTLGFSIMAAILAAVAALPVVEGLGESRWFD